MIAKRVARHVMTSEQQVDDLFGKLPSTLRGQVCRLGDKWQVDVFRVMTLHDYLDAKRSSRPLE